MNAEREFDVAAPGAVAGRPARARVHLPPGTGPFRWALLVHGYTLSGEWGFWPELARRLAAHGIASARVAFSGDGVGCDLRTVEDLSAVGHNTYVAELEDLAALRACLLDRPELDGHRGALVGHSRGGGIGVVHAAESQHGAVGYRAVALWAAFDGILRFSTERLAKWRDEGSIEVTHHGLRAKVRLDRSVLDSAEQNRSRLDVLAACGRLACPVLVVHGARDRDIPLPVAERLAAAARCSELLVIDRAGHAFGARDPLVAIPERLELLLGRTTEWLADRL